MAISIKCTVGEEEKGGGGVGGILKLNQNKIKREE